MIQANELRIGNLLEYQSDVFKLDTVQEIHSLTWLRKNVHYIKQLSLDDLKPIPLTPEILERCGFIKCINADDDVLFKKQYFEIEYMEFFSEEKNGFYYNNNMPHETHIRYLHQLQNLYFALTGEELELNSK